MKRLTLGLFLLFFIRRTADGSLLDYPTDRNATVGEHVILPCATDLPLPVYWYFNGHEIFYGGKVSMSFQAMFSVLSDKTGEYNLVISSADASYDGLYACGDDEGQGDKKSAQLYVIAATVTVAAPGGATDGDVNTRTIIGIVIAIIVVLLLATLIPVAIYLCRRCHNDSEKSEIDADPTEMENGSLLKDQTGSEKPRIAEDPTRIENDPPLTVKELRIMFEEKKKNTTNVLSPSSGSTTNRSITTRTQDVICNTPGRTTGDNVMPTQPQQNVSKSKPGSDPKYRSTVAQSEEELAPLNLRKEEDPNESLEQSNLASGTKQTGANISLTGSTTYPGIYFDSIAGGAEEDASNSGLSHSGATTDDSVVGHSIVDTKCDASSAAPRNGHKDEVDSSVTAKEENEQTRTPLNGSKHGGDYPRTETNSPGDDSEEVEPCSTTDATIVTTPKEHPEAVSSVKPVNEPHPRKKPKILPKPEKKNQGH